MPSYQAFVSRHGEVGAQALLEQLARTMHRNIFTDAVSLEHLWNELMSEQQTRRIAA